ncbi:hypothetical protein KL918_004681 [Ogataea parapolymorpha]|nr:hypothetical protein KL918_004681 [Ogataea parapolymorpha]KAG7873884.1 hypothetical protein KL916_002044 [Ogataea parapolymorpha]
MQWCLRQHSVVECLEEQIDGPAIQKQRRKFELPERVFVVWVDAGHPDSRSEVDARRNYQKRLVPESVCCFLRIDDCSDDNACCYAENLGCCEDGVVFVDKLVVQQQGRDGRREPGVVEEEAGNEGHKVGDLGHLGREEHYEPRQIAGFLYFSRLVFFHQNAFEQKHRQHHDEADRDGDATGKQYCSAVIEVPCAQEVVIGGALDGDDDETERDGSGQAEREREIEKCAVADVCLRERTAKNGSEA